MIYLLFGGDSLEKDKKIAKIKNDILPSPEALEFDFQTLHAHKLDPVILKKALVALPAVAKTRLVLIRSIQKFSNHHKKLILEFSQNPEKRIILILDADENSQDSAFIKKLRPVVKLIHSQRVVSQNVFDMTRSMASGKNVEALKTLSGLLSGGNHPLQLMGGLVWFWGKSRNRVSSEKFKEGLLALQETDLNIKRSRINSEYALEILVVKLSSLLSC